MNNNLTELVYVIDMSGSMYDLANDTIGGYNSLLAEQRRLSEDNPDMKANVTTVLFNHEYKVIHDRADIDAVNDMTNKEYVPSGMTAMLDAVGTAIVSVGQKLAAMPEEERPGLVSVTIVTDGYENSSKEYSWSTIQNMIKEQREKYSWVFSFIGADIDVKQTSMDLGIDIKLSKSFTKSHAGAASVFSSVSSGLTMMRSAVSSTIATDRSSVQCDLEDAMSAALDDVE